MMRSNKLLPCDGQQGEFSRLGGMGRILGGIVGSVPGKRVKTWDAEGRSRQGVLSLPVRTGCP